MLDDRPGCTSETRIGRLDVACCRPFIPGRDTGRLILLEDASTQEALAASISEAYLNQESEQRALCSYSTATRR